MFLVLMLVRAQRVQLLRVRPSCYSLGAGVCAVFPAGAQLGMPFCLGRQEYSHRPGTFLISAAFRSCVGSRSLASALYEKTSASAPARLLWRCFCRASFRPAFWVPPPPTPVEQELHAAKW